MCVRIHLCTFLILIGLMSGATHKVLADDLDLEPSAKISASTEAKSDTDKGAMKKGDKKSSEKEQADDAAFNGLDALALIRELNSLRIKRAKYAQNLGSGHPTIVDLDQKIRDAEAKISKAPEPNDPLTKKGNEIEKSSAKELRKAVGMLIKRVRDLEYDLSEMKRDVNVIRQRR